MRLELTEKEIVNAVKAGRREGQTEMVCHYAERVFAMIVRQVPDVMDAQEADTGYLSPRLQSYRQLRCP